MRQKPGIIRMCWLLLQFALICNCCEGTAPELVAQFTGALRVVGYGMCEGPPLSLTKKVWIYSGNYKECGPSSFPSLSGALGLYTLVATELCGSWMGHGWSCWGHRVIQKCFYEFPLALSFLSSSMLLFPLENRSNII